MSHKVRVKQRPSETIEVDEAELLDLQRLDLIVSEKSEKEPEQSGKQETNTGARFPDNKEGGAK